MSSSRDAGRLLAVTAMMLAANSLAVFAQTGGSGSGGTTGGSTGGSGMQMSQSECESLWNQADASGSGALSQTQAQPYVQSFSRVDTSGDGRLSRAEFMLGCSSGQVQRSATTGAGSGSSGGSIGTGAGSGSAGGSGNPKK